MIDRFQRHQLVPGWRQDRLGSATAVILGVGAVGNEVTRLLAMAGVGHLILCDPDRVELSNLSRTALFRERDVGRFKVEAAADALLDLAPGLAVDPRPLPLVHGVGLAELRDASIVLGCLDSRSARLALAGRCGLVRAPWIDGGTHPWGGEVRPYLDPDGPCYGCSLTAEERAVIDAPWSCLDTGTPLEQGAEALSSALVGTWMAQIAVRFLMGLSIPTGALILDGARGTTRLLEQRRDPSCPLHMPLTEPVAVPVDHAASLAELRTALSDGGVPLAWDPVQSRVECPACGFAEERWGVPSVVPCPRCGQDLRPRTTLELVAAPGSLLLHELGIAPREILAVRGTDRLRWIELAARNSASSAITSRLQENALC